MAKKYRSLSGKIFNTKLEAIADNLEYYRNASYRFDVKGLNAAKNLELELPFIEDKAITLSDAGLATGARLSTNMLDSIAKYANKAGLPILTALGLAVKESTLGNPTDDKSVYKLLSPEKELYFRMKGTGLHINKGDTVDARSMINYYKDVEDNPYYAAFGEVERRFPNDSFKLEAQLRAGENYADRQEAKRLSLKDKNVLLAGFEFYRDYPDKYNTLLLNYQLLVSKRGEEVWNSPEIQQWWNDYNLLKLLEKLYNNEGTLVRFKAAGGEINELMDWDKLSMRDRATYIRNAVSRGINTPLDIRNDYNEFKGGGKKNSGNLKKVFLNSLLLSLNGYSRYNTPLWKKFLTDLALLESSYNANALNSIGAKGYFQLMPSNRSATWSNPVLLFHEMYKLSDSNMEYFRKNLTKDDIHRAESMGIDIYGLMAGAHLGGVGNAIKALRGQGNAKDMNNSSVLGYMKKFSQTSNNTPVLTDSKVMKMPPFEYTEPPVIPALLAAVITEQPIILEPIAMGTILEEPSILQTIPEVIVTPKPRYLDDSLEILLLLSKLITPYKTIELPKPLTATERLALINLNRNTLLLKDLEDNIIRNNLLGIQNPDKLRRDAEDLRFYRNMSALGGNLFSGEENHSSQMNIFRRPNGEYFYQESPESEEITVTPLNTIFENPALWTYTDANGKLYTPRLTAATNQGSIIEKEDEGPIVEAAKNYLGELQYDINNGIPIGGKYTMPAIAATAALPIIGEAAAPILANPYVDAGLTSAFAGHGLNHAINEGIDGYEDAAMTALELAPLGRPISKALETGYGIYNNILDNYPILYLYPRYVMGKLKYGFDAELPTLYRKVKTLPKVEDGNMQISTPNSRFAYDNGYGSNSPIITNMTTDAPVRSHSGGNWDRGLTLAFPGKTLLGKHVISTRPSDTFTFGDNISVPISKVTAFSGRPKEIFFMKNVGANVVTSPETKLFWESGVENLGEQIAKARLDIEKINKAKVAGKNLILLKPKIPIDNFDNYARSIEDLTRETYKSPTMKDYLFMDYVFRPRYDSLTTPIIDNFTFDLLENNPDTYESWLGNWERRKYLEDLSRWLNLMYDPLTPVESEFRRNLNIGLKPEYKR